MAAAARHCPTSPEAFRVISCHAALGRDGCVQVDVAAVAGTPHPESELGVAGSARRRTGTGWAREWDRDPKPFTAKQRISLRRSSAAGRRLEEIKPG
jgi:hypothetical protein